MSDFRLRRVVTALVTAAGFAAAGSAWAFGMGSGGPNGNNYPGQGSGMGMGGPSGPSYQQAPSYGGNPYGGYQQGQQARQQRDGAA